MNKKIDIDPADHRKIDIDPAEQVPPASGSVRREPALGYDPDAPERPAPEQPAPAHPGSVPSTEAFFAPERREELKGTWLTIQSAFIDEPQRAVRNADELVKEILGTVSQKFETARRSLEAEWDKGDQASTEALRVALQRYRALFDRLLSL